MKVCPCSVERLSEGRETVFYSRGHHGFDDMIEAVADFSLCKIGDVRDTYRQYRAVHVYARIMPEEGCTTSLVVCRGPRQGAFPVTFLEPPEA